MKILIVEDDKNIREESQTSSLSLVIIRLKHLMDERLSQNLKSKISAL